MIIISNNYSEYMSVCVCVCVCVLYILIYSSSDTVDSF